MFKKALGLLITLLGFTLTQAQTVSVTANLKSMFGANQAVKTQACFSLVDATGQQIPDPRVSGGIIVPTSQQCLSPDSNGLISTTLYANDQITPAGSLYAVQYTYSGRTVHGDLFQFLLADGSENLNNKTPITTIPLVSPPTGDTTYARLDGGNQPFTGIVTVPAIRGPGIQKQIFTSSGTFTIPTGITQVKVTVIAGGGGGGGADAAHNGGGGGGSGSAAIKWLTGLTPGNTLTVTIGPGGSGGASPSGTGGSGTASSVSSGTQTITTINTNGGGGGGQSLTNFPGVGGPAGTGGDLNLTGVFGGTWMPPDYGGNGAPSILGGGALGAVNGASGAPGIGPGSGGSGGGGTVGNTGGGAGANGIVIFEWVN